MQAKQATEHIWWVGALDPDLRVFDIIMHLGLWHHLQLLSAAGQPKDRLV